MSLALHSVYMRRQLGVSAGGRVDKFVGDGIMALFGVDGSPEESAAQALHAAAIMARKLGELNELLAHDPPSPLRIGIGIHAGPAIVGEMGYGTAISVTAVGDTVNTASRLESRTKASGAQLVVSRHVMELAGRPTVDLRHEKIALPGRRQPMTVYAFEDAREAIAVPVP